MWYAMTQLFAVALTRRVRFLLMCIFFVGCSEEFDQNSTVSPAKIETSAAQTAAPTNPVEQKVSLDNLVAPDFKLPALSQPSNTSITLSNYQGKVVYLDFWASWCSPCRQQLPALEQLQQSMPNEVPLEIIAVSLDDQQESAQQFIAGLDLTYPLAIDTTGKVGIDYQIVGMPSGFLIDQQGFIVRSYTGFNQQKLDQLKRDLLTLMSD